MKFGAIAMFDALAFKGIWKRHNVDTVLENLVAMRRHIEDSVASMTSRNAKLAGPGRLDHAPKTVARFLSDTIIISSQVPSVNNLDVEQEKILNALMVTTVVHATAFAMAGATQGPTPLNYRGAIAWGAFTIEENFLVGPAVDEAASLYETADAAIVELTDAAAGPLSHFRGNRLVPRELQPARLVLEFDVPRKGRPAERRWVVNPFAVCTDRPQLHDVLQGAKLAFGGTPPETKYKNTMELLSAARASWEQS